MRLDFPKLPEGDFLIYTFLVIFLLLKTGVLLYIFVESFCHTLIIESTKEQLLFKIEILGNIINAVTSMISCFISFFGLKNDWLQTFKWLCVYI